MWGGAQIYFGEKIYFVSSLFIYKWATTSENACGARAPKSIPMTRAPQACITVYNRIILVAYDI